MGLKAVASVSAGGTITGSGTAGKLAKFTSATALGDSLLSESGTTITSAATAEVFGSAQTWTVPSNAYAITVAVASAPANALVLDSFQRFLGVGTVTGAGTILHASDGGGPFAGSLYEGVRLQRATEALFSASDYARSFRAGLTGSTAVVGTSTAHDLLLQRNNVTAATLQSGAIATLTLTAGGAGYTNGTYSQQTLTGGTGTGATADIVVAGGIVTAIYLRSPGTGYAAADALSCATIGAGAGFVATAATIAQVVAASGNVTAQGRIGAGTATPRAALDVVGGMVVDGAVKASFYSSQTATPFVGVHSIQIGVAGSPAIAPTSNSTPYCGLMVNPLIDATSLTTNPTRGVTANVIMTTSPIGYTGTTNGLASVNIRNEPGDLATAANILGIFSSVGSGLNLVSASTNQARTLSGFITSGKVGHTITTGTQLDLFYNATGNITTATGLNSNPISGTGTVATFYGVRIQASTTPTITNRWGISQEDALAKNYFAGNVGVGTISPVSALDVAGTITCDDNATGIKLPAAPGSTDVQTLDCYQENVVINTGVVLTNFSVSAGTTTTRVAWTRIGRGMALSIEVKPTAPGALLTMAVGATINLSAVSGLPALTFDTPLSCAASGTASGQMQCVYYQANDKIVYVGNQSIGPIANMQIIVAGFVVG